MQGLPEMKTLAVLDKLDTEKLRAGGIAVDQ
jgi:hypothetical protein